VPGIEIFGGSYRYGVVVPLVQNDQNSFGLKDDNRSIGDITITPFALSWPTKPGQFVSAGLNFNLPTGKYEPVPTHANLGAGAFSVSLTGAYSYLKDGWNLTANAAYTITTENSESEYKSGNDLLVDLTALKDVGNGLSVGLVGYWRKQLTDDDNNGVLFGGVASTRAEESAWGVALTKNWGPNRLSASILKPIDTVDTRESGTLLQLSYSIPLSGPKP